MLSFKVRKVGNSLGMTIPQEAAAALKVKDGDTVFLTATTDGYRLTPYDPAFAKQMQVAQAVMKKRRNALRVLAK